MIEFIKKQSPARIIALGFALVIFIGSLLLMLPCSIQDGVTVRYIDALYTSTSAVCVTGLIAIDAGDTFTPLGQFFLAMLIQVGGLGVTAVGAGIIVAMGRRVNLKGRVLIREAMNLALDREELCTIVGTDTEPTYNLVAKYMTDRSTGEYFVDGAEQPFEENVERARELLAEAGYPNGEGFPTLTYSYPTLEMDSDTAQVIQQQLKETLNIDIQLNPQELQANYSARHAGDFELCRMNWTADFADPYTYLSMLLSNSTYNCSGIHDEEYDAIVAQSDRETDPAKRSELMHQAEQLAVGEQFYIMPLYAMKSVNLVNPDITGIRQIPATGALDYRMADIGE